MPFSSAYKQARADNPVFQGTGFSYIVGIMAKKIPSYGRKRSEVHADLGLHTFSAPVPIGNTDPTMVQGKMYNQNLPNASRMARGGLRTYKGKYPQAARLVH